MPRSQMNVRRLFVVVVVGVFGTSTVWNSAQAQDVARRPPNVVVIMADDLGWMDLHCQGNERLDTPHLDRLATQGMRFTSGYAAAPVCTPTRAAMMTGQAPARLAITNHAPGNPDRFAPDGAVVAEADWNRHLALDYTTIAERMQAAGYATGFIGKWHLSYRPRSANDGPTEVELRPEHQGFDLNIGGCFRGGPPSYFEPYRIPNIEPRREGDYLPERLADESIAFIEQHRDGPFFLCWWNYSVHYPFEAPEELIAKYKDRVGPGIKNHVYAAQIEGMDRAIGRLLAALDERRLADDTLVIFNSDNGSNNGDNAPLRGGKGHLHEGGIRVPWIVRWPGVVEANTLCDVPVISMDTYPTILDAVGLPRDDDEAIDGVSLLPLLKQAGSLDRDELYFHYPNYAFHKRNRLGSAIREGDYKLIKWYDDDSWELYNLADDIGESRNLAESSPAVAARLAGKLEGWLNETDAKLPVRVAGDDE